LLGRVAESSGNTIAAEIARLMAGYRENFRAAVICLGAVPLPDSGPSSAIEAVAMQLTVETVLAECQRVALKVS
jgi:hypothetical protein